MTQEAPLQLYGSRSIMTAFSKFLVYFFEVSHTRSIRKAADRLHVSASAIDRQILKAEQDLGVALFERHPSGLRLTAAGEALAAWASSMRKDYARTQEYIKDLIGLRRGCITLAVIDAVAHGTVPAAVGRLSRQYPGIAFNVKSLENDAVQACVLEGEADFGIMFDPRPHRDLLVHAACRVPIGVVAPPDNPVTKLIAIIWLSTVPKVLTGETETSMTPPMTPMEQKFASNAHFGAARDVVQARCSMCHAAEPVWEGINFTPKSVKLETDREIAAHAREIYIQAGRSHAMPPGDVTAISPQERKQLVVWYESAISQ